MSDISDPDFNDGWESHNIVDLDRIQELKDRIFELEDGIEGARNTITFLHGCLTRPNYSYAYPDHTRKMLDKLNELVEPREYCVHSFTKEGCTSCQQRIEYFTKREEVRARREA